VIEIRRMSATYTAIKRSGRRHEFDSVRAEPPRHSRALTVDEGGASRRSGAPFVAKCLSPERPLPEWRDEPVPKPGSRYQQGAEEQLTRAHKGTIVGDAASDPTDD
jgi:hypothetical protein